MSKKYLISTFIVNFLSHFNLFVSDNKCTGLSKQVQYKCFIYKTTLDVLNSIHSGQTPEVLLSVYKSHNSIFFTACCYCLCIFLPLLLLLLIIWNSVLYIWLFVLITRIAVCACACACACVSHTHTHKRTVCVRAGSRNSVSPSAGVYRARVHRSVANWGSFSHFLVIADESWSICPKRTNHQGSPCPQHCFRIISLSREKCAGRSQPASKRWCHWV